jgi:secreted PhoX family phosphatase
MMTEPHNTPVPYGAEGDFDTEVSNTTNNPHFADVLRTYMERRGFLKGALGAAVGVALAGKTGELLAKDAPVAELEKAFLDNAAKNIGLPLPTRPTFQAISTARTAGVTVPPGYTSRVAFKAGEPISGSYPAYRMDGSNTGAEQEQQIGQHHDGMHYFAIPGFDANRRGIMAINHEYIEQRYLFPAGTSFTNPRPADAVRKEIAAHGVSIFETERQANGDWSIVRGPYNRRITGGTEMEITGPARGHPKMVTAFSTDGTMTRGTLNNCAHGYTPWGTYLTCEENWAGYFVNRDTTRPREHTRYGVPSTNSRYGWETAQPRFNASSTGATASADFRNEPNGQGWVVEIDPYDPTSVPKKRTGMGRFAHEGAWFAPPRTGKPYVFYMGDDSQNEYIYKFVTRWVHVPGYPNSEALNEGTLYVARFNADGTGTWLPLDINDATFRARASAAGVAFTDQGDVVINTRLAADVAGATRMDRPEWGAVDPRDGRVYFTLTNNASRTAAQVDAANPRGPNPFGHIMRWREDGDDAAALSFRWDILLLSGTETDSANFAAGPNARLTADSIHASPDGLWFDAAGTLWIQTDMSGSQQSSGPFGENAMLAMDVRTGVIRRFFAGPPGQETTGVVTTPDLRTMFINLQHPNEGGAGVANAWPDGPGTLPRSATVIINKNDGGLIGT